MKRFHKAVCHVLVGATVAAANGSAFASGGGQDDMAVPASALSGEDLATQCAACHTFAKDDVDRIGPNLYGLFGARAGTKADFAYSVAMKRSGIVWSDATVNALIADPAKAVPGTKMAFPGIADAAERRALIAYLKTATTAE